MTTIFSKNELCLLADMFCEEISDSIKHDTSIDYQDWINKLKQNNDYGGYGLKWGVELSILASKLSRSNDNNLYRLTYALKRYWEPYDRNGIELDMYEWAKNEQNNW